MGFALILVAFLAVVAALWWRRLQSPRPLIAAIVLLLPAGVAVSRFMGDSTGRSRIDVQFVGYRVPISDIHPCAANTRVADPGGAWIGGGRRWPNDSFPDVLTLPGYRAHLMELCKEGNAFAARLVKPGYDLVDAGTSWNLVAAREIDTQRVYLRSQDAIADADDPKTCLRIGATEVATRPLVDFVRQQYKADLIAAPKRSLIQKMKNPFQTPRPGEVFCLTVSGTTAARCNDSTPAAEAVFLWQGDRRWEVDAPAGSRLGACGATVAGAALDRVTIAPSTFSGAYDWDRAAEASPEVHLAMIDHRVGGAVADQTVRMAQRQMMPSPFRLGQPYQVRFGRAGHDLIVFMAEPSIQLRTDDLFGTAARSTRPGEIDITFSEPRGEEVLAVNLGARADHFIPKSVFEGSTIRASVSPKGEEILVTPPGGAMRRLHLGTVFSIPVGNRSGIEPMIAIRRVVPPLGTFLLPLLASLALLATMLAAGRARRLDAELLLMALLLALLDTRFLLATRAVVNDPASSDAMVGWIVDGAYLFVLPALCLLVAAAVRAFDTARETADPGLRSRASTFLRQFTDPGSTAHAALISFLAAVAAATIWILFAAPLRSTRIAAFKELRNDSAAVLLVVFFAVVAHGVAAVWMRRGAVQWNDSALARRLPVVAFTLGLAVLVLRVASTYLFGKQEALPGGVRADVVFLPLAAAVLGALVSRTYDDRRATTTRLLSVAIFCLFAFGLVAVAANDFGLLWIGAMACVLCLPAALPGKWTYILTVAGFLVFFLTPILLPRKFGDVLATTWHPTVEVNANLSFEDRLQLRRPRDYYRALDAIDTKLVEDIPSQVAREVVLEHERVRYQALQGAWREGFRSEGVERSPLLGAGFLRAKPVVGDSTFLAASRSDYVYPTYVRAEFGTVGMLGILAVYVALFVAGASLGTRRPFAAWVLAIVVGSGLFMLGGTAGVFPFSGKWPMLMSFLSSSDSALAAAAVALAMIERSR